MPEPIGHIIADDTGGKPDTNVDPKSSSGTERRNSEPEIVYGFDAVNPATERFAAGSSGNPRLTKSGRIDRRTLRGGAGGNRAEETPGLLDGSKISLEGLLYSLHLMGKEILSLPEMEIDRDEAKKLAEAVAEVNRFYKVAIDPKKLAWVNLGLVGVTIYGPRFAAARNRRKIAAREGKAPVTPIDQPGKNPPAPPPKNGRINLDPNGRMANASPSMIDVFGDQNAAI